MQLEEENQMLTERLLDWEAGESEQHNLHIQELYQSQIEALSTKYEERLCEADARLLELESLCLFKDSQSRQLRDIVARLQSQLAATDEQLNTLRSQLDKVTAQNRILEERILSKTSDCEQGVLTDDVSSSYKQVSVQTPGPCLCQEHVTSLMITSSPPLHFDAKSRFRIQRSLNIFVPKAPVSLTLRRRVFVCQILSYADDSDESPKLTLAHSRRSSFALQRPKLKDLSSSICSLSQDLPRQDRPPFLPTPLTASLPPQNGLIDRPCSSPRRMQRRQERLGSIPFSPIKASSYPQRPMTTSLTGWLTESANLEARKPKQRDLSLLRETLHSQESLLIGRRGRRLSSKEITMRFNTLTQD